MESQANGFGTNSDSSSSLQRILEALQIVHAPQSSNDQRQAATAFLEDSKKESPYNGYTLASDTSQSPVVRHYGLSWLEQALRYRWEEYDDEHTAVLRTWVIELGKNIRQEDPGFLRNKVAQLWAETAKRCWGSEWMDMDSMLNEMWLASMVHKEFVLIVLESLSEDVFSREDPVATLNSQVLSKACVEIFTADSVLKTHFPDRDTDMGVRCGGEGWMVRVGELLGNCLKFGVEQNQQAVLKALTLLKSTTTWAILPGLAFSRTVERCCGCMGSPNPPTQLAAIEVLHNIYMRSPMTDEDFRELVLPMFQTDTVLLMRKLYEWTIVDVTDIDEEKYLLSKKLSELLSSLAGFLEERPEEIPEAADVPGFLEMLLAVTRNSSLTVSIPILNMWTKLLKSEGVVESDAASQMIPPLLELCSDRLIRYEQLPEDSKDVCSLFLNEDFDTVPEKHAFIGNYRRYCTHIVEIVVRQKPFDALYHILGQVEQYLKGISQQGIDINRYRKANTTLLAADAKFSFVEAGLRGYMKWKNSTGASPQVHEQERTLLEQSLENWCSALVDMDFGDPLIRKRALQVAVAFSTTALNTKTNVMLKVLEHLLSTLPPSEGTNQEYTEAMKELQSDCSHELQRLAVKMPDYLINVYDELQAKVNEIISTSALDKRQETAYHSFLFTIVASSLDADVRAQKLNGFLAPVLQAWRASELESATSSVENFRQAMLIDKVQDYLARLRVHEIKDWSHWVLNDEGKRLQEEMSNRLNALPLRATKGLLGVSTEKVKLDSPQHKTACEIWSGLIPVILPRILDMIQFSQSFHNPESWPQLHSSALRTILADRFWQACISTGTRDDFYARVSNTKATMEGFASSIRGTLRTIRESCYSIIYSMSRFREHFYGIDGLAGPLANSVLAEAHHLSAHQFSILLTMVRHVIDDCPPSLREPFLPPLVASLMTQMDTKIMGEWDAIAHRTSAPSGADDDLTAEMKEESILRHLTWPAVMIVASLLDPDRDTPPRSRSPHGHRRRTSSIVPSNAPLPRSHQMRPFILSNLNITIPLLIFSCNALRIRDTRCCGVIIRVLSSLLPSFIAPTPASNAEVREYLSSDVLRGALTSLHEPYFVDLQRDLAGLIAGILTSYAPSTETGIEVVGSLRGIGVEKVRKAVAEMTRVGTPASSNGPGQMGGGGARAQRAVLLRLLDGLRGVSVSEMGKVKRESLQRPRRKREVSKMMEGFMTVDETSTNGAELEGIQGLFGEAN
ncbi:MAG: hypothetical protein M1814_003993 [Vezdaea aestivalis]|nr:MAG: hypothetical protein M1814_003993 [Vezdaea aestivalis]